MHGVPLSKEQYPKTFENEQRMKVVPYALAVESLMYVMLCPRPYICYAVGKVERYQSNSGPKYWIAVKHNLKILTIMG